MTATPENEWIAAGIFTLIAYAVSLSFIWRHFGKSQSWSATSGTALARSIHDEVERPEPQLAPLTAPIPDMTVHDLFFHVCPDLLEGNPKDVRWQKVGAEIRDKCAIGQLKMWGRKIDPRTDRQSGLSVVPENYWPDAEFTYAFLEDGRERSPHSWTPTRPGPTQNDYADFQVNRMQAFSIWPQRFKGVGINIVVREPPGNTAAASPKISRADIRFSYKWDNEASPASADYGFKIFAKNCGPINADVGDVFAEFRTAADDSPIFVDAKPRPMNTVFVPGYGRDVFSMRLPNGVECLLFCGFLRWKDDAGNWEHLFRMRPRAHPKMNEHHFTQVGNAPWNDVRALPPTPALADRTGRDVFPDATPELIMENGQLVTRLVAPRMDTIHVSQIRNETELFELVRGQEVLVTHYSGISLNDETRQYADDLISKLDAVLSPKKTSPREVLPSEQDDIIARLRASIVLLRGNGIYLYGDTHFKYLPERSKIPPTPDPQLAEFQAILVFGPQPPDEFETIEVQIDHGQPRVVRPIPF